MASGIRASGNRPKINKRLRGNAKTKRIKNDTEKQAAYKTKVAARRAKKMKK
jgi:hypothetical protein